MNANEMRLFHYLCNTRAPQNIFKVPLKTPRLSLKLRDYVSGRNPAFEKRTSIQEIINVINAMSKHDFNTQYCQKEIAALQSASQAEYDAWRARKAQAKSGEIQPGQNLGGVRLNKYLKKFPEPKKTDYWKWNTCEFV